MRVPYPNNHSPPNIRHILFWLAITLLISCGSQSKNILPDTNPFVSTHSRKNTAFLSKYDGLRNMFYLGKIPPLEKFIKNALWAGKCAIKFDPQVFVEDLVNTYHEQDSVLGKAVYFIPAKEEEIPHSITKENAFEYHQKKYAERRFYTPMLYQYPQEMPFSSFLKSEEGKSAYVFYSQDKREKQDGNLPFKAYFRMRSKGDILISEYFCPYLTGCQFKHSKEKYSHLQPYAYCYYQKKFEFNSSPVNRQLAREIMAMPVEGREEEF